MGEPQVVPEKLRRARRRFDHGRAQLDEKIRGACRSGAFNEIEDVRGAFGQNEVPHRMTGARCKVILSLRIYVNSYPVGLRAHQRESHGPDMTWCPDSVHRA